nr:MAG TPA: hypothetical protein [Caudoviricetes sp.]
MTRNPTGAANRKGLPPFLILRCSTITYHITWLSA